MTQNPKKSDTGLTVETYWNIHIPKELVPLLIGIGVALLAGSGVVLSSDFNGPDQVAPLPTEVKK